MPHTTRTRGGRGGRRKQRTRDAAIAREPVEQIMRGPLPGEPVRIDLRRALGELVAQTMKDNVHDTLGPHETDDEDAHLVQARERIAALLAAGERFLDARAGEHSHFEESLIILAHLDGRIVPAVTPKWVMNITAPELGGDISLPVEALDLPLVDRPPLELEIDTDDILAEAHERNAIADDGTVNLVLPDVYGFVLKTIAEHIALPGDTWNDIILEYADMAAEDPDDVRDFDREFGHLGIRLSAFIHPDQPVTPDGQHPVFEVTGSRPGFKVDPARRYVGINIIAVLYQAMTDLAARHERPCSTSGIVHVAADDLPNHRVQEQTMTDPREQKLPVDEDLLALAQQIGHSSRLTARHVDALNARPDIQIDLRLLCEPDPDGQAYNDDVLAHPSADRGVYLSLAGEDGEEGMVFETPREHRLFTCDGNATVNAIVRRDGISEGVYCSDHIHTAIAHALIEAGTGRYDQGDEMGSPIYLRFPGSSDTTRVAEAVERKVAMRADEFVALVDESAPRTVDELLEKMHLTDQIDRDRVLALLAGEDVDPDEVSAAALDFEGDVEKARSCWQAAVIGAAVSDALGRR